MAQEQSPAPTPVPWTKIFSAFKIALDVKKLLLAAIGIFAVAFGWWLLGWTFYGMRSFPTFVIDLNAEKDSDKAKAEKAAWVSFQAKRKSWNLIHELAGSPSDRRPIDAGDIAESVDEYKLLHEWEQGYRRLLEEVTVKKEKLTVPGMGTKGYFTLTPVNADTTLSDKEAKLTVAAITAIDKDKKSLRIQGVVYTAEGDLDELKKHRDEGLEFSQIIAKAHKHNNPELAVKALKKFEAELVRPKIKPSGKLRTWPWFEERGGNPYLIVSETVKTRGENLSAKGQFLHWLFGEQAPVLMEPLFKFLAPIVYLFDARAGFWDRLYLLCLMLWTLAIWGYFGGAICRIAAVQVARNERISLREALSFTRERCTSYIAAPAFPLLLLGIFVVALVVFGWIEWIPVVGDVFAGLFWPVVLLIGFVMAVVLVGLVGWPLMVATISTEGTDSFDALSRSYSYVYQAPWQYLWYSMVAVVYGAFLVFFVGFMASLLVFIGKWGVSCAPGLAGNTPEDDRDPSYLFWYAPTSFGWRDLLISSSSFTRKEGNHLEFTPEYEATMKGWHYTGAALVSVWIWPFFLLVVGFGYSYFWSASTVIYFLMRKHVDDTEMDEVHMEDDDLDESFMNPATPAASGPSATAAGKPGTLSLNVVDAPPPSPPSPPDSTSLPPLPLADTPPAPPPSDGHA